jgi:flagellar protein FlaD
MVGLFRKKPTKDGSSARRKLKDFEEEEEALEAEEESEEEVSPRKGKGKPARDADEEVEDEVIGVDEDSAGLSSVKEMSELLGRMDEVADKLGRLDSALTMVRNDTIQVRDRMNQTEQDVRRLLSVYEVVSAKFNPFIEISDNGASKSGAAAPAAPGKGEELKLPEIDLGGDLPEFRPFQDGEPEELPFVPRKPAEPKGGAPPWEPGTSTVVMERGPAGSSRQRAPPTDKASQDVNYEREVRAAAKSKHNKKPLLAYIAHDYLTLVMVMRWIEFLFERVTRDKISLVLDYYVDVGWISEDVKSEVMSYARGEMQDITKYMAPEETREEVFRDMPVPAAAPYKKVEDWRLSAEDHLKSLLFIQKIAGLEVDKDRLNSLEQNISKFKESLEGFHGV